MTAGRSRAPSRRRLPSDAELVVTRNPPADRKATLFADLIGAEDDAGVAAANAKVTPDTIAKFLFTSGSTGNPKGVINTHRMLCSNQAMIGAGFAFVADEPPVVVDWLPWSHTFGSNHNFNMVLVNGGSLYIDDGNPTPPGVPKTARNLREIAPTIYFNVPKGYEALVPHFRADETLRKNFFSRLKVLFYAGAGLNQTTWDDLTQLAIETTGERIIFLSSLGSTETSPLALACMFDFDRPGNIGLPAPGVELKLVPNEGKLEARLRGPHITPGYWRQQQLTREAFDAEGFYKIGDALKFADPADPAKASCSTAASPRTSSFPPAPGSASGRCARASSMPSRPTCATWCSPAPTATISWRWCFPTSRPAASWRPSMPPMRRPRPCSTTYGCG